jgi:hypothetical protein
MKTSLEVARKRAIQDRKDREQAEKRAKVLETGAVSAEELLHMVVEAPKLR